MVNYSIPEIMTSTRSHGYSSSVASPSDYDFIKRALEERSQYFSRLKPRWSNKTRIRRLAATASSLAENLTVDGDSITFSLDEVITVATKELDKDALVTNKPRAISDIKSLLNGIAGSVPSRPARYGYTARYTATRETGVIYRCFGSGIRLKK